MIEHSKVTEDRQRNVRLIGEYDTAEDTGYAFTAYIRSLGYESPQRSDVAEWGICVIGDDDGVEWLAWDAASVCRPEVTGGPTRTFRFRSGSRT